MSATPAVMIHWLRPDPSGPIRSPGIPELEVPGGTYLVACWPTRPTVKNIHATDLPGAVTCPRCRARKEFLALPEHVRRQGRPKWERGETAQSALLELREDEGEG